MLRIVVAALLAVVLGTLAGCIPAAVAYVPYWGSTDGQFGMLIFFLLVVNVPLGMIAGLAGGIMYGVQQPLFTAASPSLGVVAGGVLSVWAVYTTHGPWSLHLIWLAPFLGGVLGLLVSRWTWRRK